MATPATGDAPRSTAGTLTFTVQEAPAPPISASRPPEAVVLRLSRPKKRVSWKEGTVDNEFLGRRSSEKCCVFHKQKPFDEDSSDDEAGSRGGSGDGADEVAGGKPAPGCCPSHGAGGR